MPKHVILDTPTEDGLSRQLLRELEGLSLTKTARIIYILLGEIQQLIKTLHFILKAVPKVAYVLLQNRLPGSL